MTTDALPARTAHRVAVIGGGASGVLTAINLLARSDDPRLEVVIHEASGVVGRGVASAPTTSDTCSTSAHAT